MIAELPLSADPAQSFTCQLGGVKYFFDVRYNSRNGVWTFDLSDDATRTPILSGVAIVLGVDLLEPYNLGIGRLLAVDGEGRGRDAGADDLGSRVTLNWISPDEALA